MGRIHFVKKARKPNPVADIGESYWWWELPYENKKYYSKTYPTPQQILEQHYPTQDLEKQDA